MNQDEMIQSLRAEIAKLQRVLDLLLGQGGEDTEVRRPGRPTGSGNKATSFNPEEFAPRKRAMSAEGKARIAAAQKKRWAAQKTTTPDRVVRKQAASTKRTSKNIPPKSAPKPAPTAASKKSAGAGKKSGSTQKRAATVAPRKTVATKAEAKKGIKSVAKRPAKRVLPTGPEPQATA